MKLPVDILTETLAFTTVELMNFKERAAQFEAMLNEQKNRADGLVEALIKSSADKSNADAANDELRAELEALQEQMRAREILYAVEVSSADQPPTEFQHSVDHPADSFIEP